MHIIVEHTHINYNCGEYVKTIKKYLREYNENTYLKDVIEEYSMFQIINFNYYYDLSSAKFEFLEILPFIITIDSKTIWDVEIKSVKLIDFLNTHNIEEVLKVETFCGEIGSGHVIKDLYEFWTAIYPILVDISENLAVYYIYTKTIKCLIKMFKKKKVHPLNLVDFIYKRDQWNHFELSKLIDLDVDKTKSLLVLFVYKWNNKTKMYEVECRDEIRKKIKKMDFSSSRIP